jgi:hypothetical protein
LFIISYSKNGKDLFLTKHDSDLIFSSIKSYIKTFESIDAAKNRIVEIKNQKLYKNYSFYISTFKSEEVISNDNVVNSNLNNALQDSLNKFLPKELDYSIIAHNEKIEINTFNKSKKWNFNYNINIQLDFELIHIELALKHWQKLSKSTLENYTSEIKNYIHLYLEKMIIR